MMKKIILIFLYTIVSQLVFASENIRIEENSSSSMASAVNSKGFHLGDIIKNEISFTKMVEENVSILKLDSANEVQVVLLNNKLKGFPLVSEFIYQLLQRPNALAKFLRIFFNTQAFILFSLGMIFSLIISHYLGEFKFKFKTLSFARVSYSFFRFSVVNIFRVWLFIFLFSENVKPISKVYLTSVYNVADAHPVLFKVSSLFAGFF